MKEKLQRFITAFKMNGQVKKRTITVAAIVVAVIAIVVVLLCLNGCNKQPDEPVVDDTRGTICILTELYDAKSILEVIGK